MRQPPACAASRGEGSGTKIELGVIFDEAERAPANGLLYQFEAISQLTQDEQAVVREVLEGLIIKYRARRWDSARPPLTPRQARQEAAPAS